MHSLRNTIFTVLLVFFAWSVQGQGYGKKIGDNFPTTNIYNAGGWMVSPGLTLMTPNPGSGTVDYSIGTDTINRYVMDRNGGVGLYLDMGRFRLTENMGYIRWIDYGIHYKSLTAAVDVAGTTMVESTEEELATFTASGEFKDRYAGAFFNAYMAKAITKYEFITHGPGINVGYAFGQKRTGTALPGEVFPGKWMAQIHYKVGVGIKVANQLILVPSIETPILSGWEWQKGRSSTPYFPTRYRPIIVSLKFLLLETTKEICPPSLNPDLPKDFIPDGSMGIPGY